MLATIRIQYLLGVATIAALSSPAVAQVTYSIDWHGPTVGAPAFGTGIPITEGDILTVPGPMPLPGGGAPLPAPVIAITGGPGGLGLGLHPGCVGHPGGTMCGVEVDALSFGNDAPFQQFTLGMPGRVLFSTDEFALGMGGVVGLFAPPNLASEAPIGDSAADVWGSVPMPPAPVPPFGGPGGNAGVLDGDGLPSASGYTYPGLGLIEPTMPGPPPNTGDNLDAFDFGGFGALPGTYFSLDSGIPDPRTGVPASGSAFAHGFTGADVLWTPGPGAAPIVYAPGLALGLNFMGPFDDLDALALAENGIPGYQASQSPYDWLGGGTDMLLFSVRSGSPVIGMPDSFFGFPIEEGDILTAPIAGGLTPFPAIFIAAENLGLVTLRSFPGVAFADDLDALDITHGPLYDCDANGTEDALDLAFGLSMDVNKNGVPDPCEGTIVPFCFCAGGAPCGNADAGAGCANSTGTGSLLTAVGSTSLAADDLVLSANSLPAGTFGLLFLGTMTIGPVPFGDGQRCVGGAFNRFPVRQATAAGVLSEGPGLGALYGFGVGQNLLLQGWYRDGAGPCGGGFNFTSALSVTYTP